MSELQCVRIPVRDGQTERVAAWIRSLNGRLEEVRDALEAEGIEAETVLLEPGDPDHLLVLVRARDLVEANAAFLRSQAPVDVEFKALMQEALHADRATPLEILLDERADGAR